jgi:ABC-2 type transport system permease protein
MKRIKAIFKKEMQSYVKSPTGWVIFAIFMAVSGVYFSSGLSYSSVDMAGEISFLQAMLFVIVPLLTMKSFSEERRNGTEVLLLTSPATLTEVVLGKYFAVLAMYLLMTSGTIIHIFITVYFGGLIGINVLGAYIGYILIGAAYLSIGIFASALTENQVIAAVVSFVSILMLSVIDSIANVIGNTVAQFINKIDFLEWIPDTAITSFGSAIVTAIKWVNPSSRLSNILVGIFEIAPLVFFVSLVAIFLYLTMRIIEKRRWSQR